MEFDTTKADEGILPGEGGVRWAVVGEGILMMGRAWEEGGGDSGGGVMAVPHRSPEIGVGEGRILLTVDLVAGTGVSDGGGGGAS